MDALNAGRAQSNVKRTQRKQAGIEWARAWRVSMKPVFDEIFGPETTDG